jgi:hypothetical protein
MVERVEVLTIIEGEEIAAGGSVTSQMIDMERKEGFGSVHINTTGSGTIRVSYQLSNDIKNAAASDKNWVAGTTNLINGHTAGNKIYSMPDEAFFAKFLRFVLTETTTTDGVTASAWAATQ